MAKGVDDRCSTIEATPADGTAYRLEIPEYGVAEPTPITRTRVSAVDELGPSGGRAGAVYLQPSGLALAVPATQTITTAASAPRTTAPRVAQQLLRHASSKTTTETYNHATAAQERQAAETLQTSLSRMLLIS